MSPEERQSALLFELWNADFLLPFDAITGTVNGTGDQIRYALDELGRKGVVRVTDSRFELTFAARCAIELSMHWDVVE